MSFSLLSLNVRGLGNKEKRTQVYQWLKNQNNTFYFLQETHSSSNTKQLWESEWGQTCFFSGASSNSEGIAILINQSFSKTKVGKHTEIIPGRLQSLEVNIEDKEFLFINVYGPNNDNQTLFDKLHAHLSENDDNYFIIGGDFNTVLDPKLIKIEANTIHIKNVELLSII